MDRCNWYVEGSACNMQAFTKIRLNFHQADVLVPVCQRHEQIYKHRSRTMRVANKH